MNPTLKRKALQSIFANAPSLLPQLLVDIVRAVDGVVDVAAVAAVVDLGLGLGDGAAVDVAVGTGEHAHRFLQVGESALVLAAQRRRRVRETREEGGGEKGTGREPEREHFPMEGGRESGSL